VRFHFTREGIRRSRIARKINNIWPKVDAGRGLPSGYESLQSFLYSCVPSWHVMPTIDGDSDANRTSPRLRFRSNREDRATRLIAKLKRKQKMLAQVTKQFRLREGRTFLLLAGLLAIAALNAAAQAPSGASNGEARFAVAHQTFGGWCYGYLYVTANQVRYEVVQPQSDHGHSFTADRSDVVAGHRTLFGQQEPALQYFINIKVKRQSYNFLWLANEAEVKYGGAHRMTPPQAAPPDTVLAALQNPPPSDAASQAAAAPYSPPPAVPWTASANAAGARAQAQPANAPDPVPEGDVRFAVAHQHRNSSWCYGYLYVTNDQVRYEVVQPASDQKHGFAINRAGVTARSLVQDAFELVAPGATYRFRWLANEADVNSASARPANPPAAAPPDLVIKKIQSPTAGTPEVMSRPALELPATLEPTTGTVQNEVEAARPELWR
jgi:hypothetical protein